METPAFFTAIAIIAAVAALFVAIVHLYAFVNALRNPELQAGAKTIWAILSAVFLFLMPVSPIPFYFFYAQSERIGRLIGTLTLISIVVLDGIVLWAHIATNHNYAKSMALMRFLPAASKEWAVTDLPNAKPFISTGLVVSAVAKRVYTSGPTHKITLSILTSPLVMKANQMMLSAVPPSVTPDMVRDRNITLKKDGYTFIKDCLAVYQEQDHLLTVIAGDYNIYITSTTESVETLEQLARAVDVYELRRLSP